MSDTEEVKTEEGVGTSEHDLKMIAVAEGKEPAKTEEATPEPERPEWLPEKYKTIEDFVAGHKELEKTLGKPKDEEVTSDNEVTDEVVEAVKGLDFEPFYDEYAQNGKLGEDSYKALEEKGISKDIIDTYINGYEAQVKAVQGQAVDIVGGQEAYDAMVEWASEALSTEEIKSYNAQLKGDQTQWELALRGLQAKYIASGDAPVDMVRSGEKPVVKGVQPFGSQKEMQLAMSDPQYKTDPSYRDKIMARLAVTDNDLMGANIIEGVVSFG